MTNIVNAGATTPYRRGQARRTGVLCLLLSLAAFIAAECVHLTGASAALDRVYTDSWHRLSGQRYEARHTALVVVDEASLARYPDDPLVFWAPLFARAAKTLREAGATVVGLDFVFSVTPEKWLARLDLPPSESLRQYDLAFRRELNLGHIVMAGAIAHGGRDTPDNLLLPHADYLLSLPATDIAGGIGLADLETDADGVVRRFRLTPQMNLPAALASGAPRLSFAALLAVRAAKLSPAANHWQWRGLQFSTASSPLISYGGPPGSMPRVSFQQLLQPGALADPAIQALRGKVVIIGADYLGMNDVHETPYGRGSTGDGGVIPVRHAGMAGAEIQAHIVETLLSGKATHLAPDTVRWALTITLLLAATLLCLRHSPGVGMAVTAAGVLLACALAYGAFQAFWVLPVASMQIALAVAFLLTLGLRLTREERDKAHMRRLFEGYVSDEVVNLLIDSGGKIDPGGQSMHITVLFSDIRNFTTITEKLDAHEVVEFLNAYFARVIEVIQNEGGRIDKFIGDAVMAEFGVPYPFPDHATRALQAALRMRAIADDFRGWMQQRFAGRGLPDFAIGIGLHSGSAVVGNLGSARRMEFTAIGDTVNVASRLEGETKNMGCVILASAQSIAAAGRPLLTGRTEVIHVKGRAESIEVSEVIDFK